MRPVIIERGARRLHFTNIAAVGQRSAEKRLYEFAVHGRIAACKFSQLVCGFANLFQILFKLLTEVPPPALRDVLALTSLSKTVNRKVDELLYNVNELFSLPVDIVAPLVRVVDVLAEYTHAHE